MVLMSQKDVNIKAETNAKIDTIFDDPSTVPVLNFPVMKSCESVAGFTRLGETWGVSLRPTAWLLRTPAAW